MCADLKNFFMCLIRLAQNHPTNLAYPASDNRDLALEFRAATGVKLPAELLQLYETIAYAQMRHPMFGRFDPEDHCDAAGAGEIIRFSDVLDIMNKRPTNLRYWTDDFKVVQFKRKQEIPFLGLGDGSLMVYQVKTGAIKTVWGRNVVAKSLAEFFVKYMLWPHFFLGQEFTSYWRDNCRLVSEFDWIDRDTPYSEALAVFEEQAFITQGS